MDIITRLFEERDQPGQPMADYDRVWRWGLSLYAHNWEFMVGVGRYLVQYQGKPRKPRLGTCAHLVFRPLEWRLGTDHTYYDGPHCSYALGPFGFTKEGWWDWRCKCFEGMD